MQYRNNTTRLSRALTLVEMVIAMAIMAIVFAAILPQFRAIQNSWASKQAAAETLQNSRVLMEHLYRNFSKAVKITAVSDSSETNGYIEFEDNDENIFRYDIADSNYVEFGPVGDLYDLAGPVSQLQFTCYDGNDFDIAITDVNDIRFIKVQTTLTNPAAMGHDKTFTTYTYLRTNATSGGGGLVVWWKLDETVGITASDSSGNGYDGTLILMNPGTDWVTGKIGGALDFDGNNDKVENLDADSYLNGLSAITVALWVKSDVTNQDRGIMFTRDPTMNDEELGIRYDAAGWGGGALSNIKASIRTTSNYTQIESTSNMQSTSWQHLAIAWESGTSLKLYIDGHLDPLTYDTGPITGTVSNVQKLMLGQGTYSNYWDGLIDDVRIYNYALDAEEIAQLANILTYKEFTEAKAGSDTTSITISTPPGTNEGDLLITAVGTNGDTSGSMAPPPSEGWTQINLNDYSSEVTLGVWWKLADTSESASHQFTWSGDETAYAWIMRFIGHDSDDPINIWAADGETDSNPTCPAVTTTVNNCFILRLGAFDDGDVTVDAPGLSGHTSITMDKSSSGSGGNVQLLTSWTSGLSHSAGAGSNRLLIFTAHVEDDDADMSLNSVTYGGQSMTRVIERETEESPYRAYVVAYILNENGIDNASGNTFSPSWSSTPDSVAYSSVFLSNVDQTTSTGASASNGSNTASTISTSALSTNNGDMVIVAGTAGNTGTYTVNSPFTEALDLSITSADGVTGYKQATGSDETPSITHSNPFRQVIIGLVVQGGGGGSAEIVSGGAGYVKQATSGTSGTSTFSLTASQESRVVTLAIAPNPADGAGGGGIYP